MSTPKISLMPGQNRPYLFLLFDAVGHSKWSSRLNASSIVKIKGTMRKQARALAETFSGTEFSFSGDGGVYIFPIGPENNHHPKEGDFTLLAATQLKAVLADLSNMTSIVGGPHFDLSFRICLHRGNIEAGESDEDWGDAQSDEINWFIKGEKNIGISDRIVCTQSFYSALSETSRKTLESVPGVTFGDGQKMELYGTKSPLYGLREIRLKRNLQEFQERLRIADDIIIVAVTAQALVMGDQAFFRELTRNTTLHFGILDPCLLENDVQRQHAVNAMQEIVNFRDRDDDAKRNITLSVILNRIHFAATIIDWGRPGGELRVQPYCQGKLSGSTPMYVFEWSGDPLINHAAQTYVESVMSMLSHKKRTLRVDGAKELDLIRIMSSGRESGRKLELRMNIREFCHALSVEWSDDRAASVESLSLSDLEIIWSHVINERTWPE